MPVSGGFENVLPANADTILTITGFGFVYQARDLNQTLEVIGAASQLDRTINGKLIDLSAAQFRKYASKITIPSEVNPSPIDGIWPGMQVTVDCAVGLSYPTGTIGNPARPVVSGSDYTEGSMSFYRPVLVMRVVHVETHFDEWKCVVGWTLELEEI